KRHRKPSMLRITRCMSADGAERYFDEALKRSDYYAKELGLWGGKGAERLQLKGEVEREDFVALVRNRVPRSKGQGRLTARDNTTREEWKLHPRYRPMGIEGGRQSANRLRLDFQCAQIGQLVLGQDRRPPGGETRPPSPCGNHG